MSRRIIQLRTHQQQVLPELKRRGHACNRLALAALLLLLIPIATPSHIHAQPPDQSDEWQRLETYFEGLRSRGLYSLAETVCHRKLTDRNLDLVSRTRYAVELSRTLTEHSRTVATLEDQTELLKEARQVVEQILKNRQNHPQEILLESQLAFVNAFELESLRWRVDLSPHDQALIEQSIRLTDSLIPQLQQLDRRTGEMARSVQADALGEKLQPHQLRSLQRAIQLRLGQVFLDKAQLYPQSSSDRAAALVNASEVLRRPATIASGDQTMWHSQLAYATTLRLRGTPEAAWAMLNAMREDQPPAAVMDAITVEHVELLLVEDRVTDAADALRKYQKETRRLTGPLSFLSARVFLQLARIATDRNRPDLAAELQQEVERSIQMATATGNNYWATRARNLIADEESRSTYGAEVGSLVREGQTLFASGKTAIAAQRYQKAFITAQNQKAHESAAEIGYTYGSILLKLKQFSEAADVLNRVTQLNPEGPQAADADLLVAWCRGMEYRSEPTAARREAYTDALEHHRTKYSESVTAGEAGWMLAQLQEQRLQTTRALQLYATVPAGHPRYAESMTGVVRCSEIILNRLRRLNKSRSEWEPAIVRLLSPYIQSAMSSGSSLTPMEADFFVRTSRILLTFTSPDYMSADRLLQYVLSDASKNAPQQEEPQSPETIETATALRVVSLTGLGKTEQANDLLKSAVLLDREHLIGILRGLESMAESLPADRQRELGQLQLASLELANLNALALSDSDLERFGSLFASAFERIGQQNQAVAILERLLTKQPANAELRRRVAAILLESGKPEEVKAAQTQFRKLGAALKPGTDEWLDTRIHVIEAAITLKDFTEARKLLKVTRLLYPNINNADLNQRLKDASAAVASTD